MSIVLGLVCSVLKSEGPVRLWEAEDCLSIEGARGDEAVNSRQATLALQKYCIEGCMRTSKAGKCNTYQQQLQNEIGLPKHATGKCVAIASPDRRWHIQDPRDGLYPRHFELLREHENLDAWRGILRTTRRLRTIQT